MPNRDLKVTLVGDDKTSGAFHSASRNAEGFGSKIGTVGKGMALAFGGAVVGGVVGLGAAFVQGAKDAASYQQITDQVAQTIKSTGGAAGVTVGGLKDYAGQLETMSGVDEELILKGQNVLLTFTGIHNQVGKGNDIFNQASLAASNLSATMGIDLVSANTLVGKALNDPIKGITALRKMGVSFNDEQKKQIETMVKSGDTMGAQKVILAELSKEFGGAAAAAGHGLTGALAHAKDAFQDMFRGIAGALLPKLAELASFFADKLIPGIQGLFDLVIGGNFTKALREAFGWEEDSGPVVFLTSVRDAIIALWPHVVAVGQALLGVARDALPVLAAAFQTVVTVISSVVGFFTRHELAAKALGVAVGIVAGLVVAAWTAQAAASVAGSIRSVISWLAVATGAQVAAEGSTRSTAQIVFGWIAAAAGAVANAAVIVGGWVMMGVQSLIQAARMAAAWVIAMGPVGWVIAAVVGLVALIVANWDTVVSWTTTAWHAVVGAISAAWEWIKSAVSAALDFVVNLFLNFTGPGLIIKHWNDIVNFTRNAWNAVTGAISGAWNAITGAISSGVSTAVSFVASLPGRFLGALGNLGSLLLGAGRNLLEGLWNGIQGAASWLLGKVGAFFGNLLPGWVRSMLGIKSPSTVFAEMGRYLMLGMADGIGAGQQHAVDAALNAAGAITGAMQVRGSAAFGAAGGGSVLFGGQPAMAMASSGPAVHIENYNEARQSPHEIAADLTFMARAR